LFKGPTKKKGPNGAPGLFSVSTRKVRLAILGRRRRTSMRPWE
jgi:hypothetical protein